MSAGKKFETLFYEPKESRTDLSRCRDLVPLKREICLRCGGELRRETHDMTALFYHGGYGATRRTTFALCIDSECRWTRLVSVDEVRPERVA